MEIATDEARWERRTDKTARYAYVIAVKTTGIYCRPGCGGRPLRKNVVFYEGVEGARAAGFRACLRCKPDE